MNTHALIEQIRHLHQSGEIESALDLYHQHWPEKEVGTNPELTLLYGILLVFNGQQEAAQETLSWAVEHEPNNPAWLSDRGLGFLLLGKIQDALEVLEKAIANPEADAVAWGRLGAVRLTCNDLSGAEEAYKEAVTREPGRAEWHNNLGGILVRQQRLEEALEHYDRALRLNPDLQQSIQARQRVLVALDRPDEAVETLQQQLNQDPNNLSCRLRLARGLDLANRPQEAIGQLNQALQLLESSSSSSQDTSEQASSGVDATTIYLEMAQFFSRRDQHARAATALSQAEQYDPNHIQVQNQKAIALKEMGHAAQALETINAAIATHPDHLALQATRATIYSELGDYAAAESELRQLLTTYPGDALLLSTLGHTLMWVGRVDEAVDCFERASEINPMTLANLVEARSFPEKPEVIEQMKNLADNLLLPDAPRTSMSFALAKLFDKREEPDTAFHYLDQGNRLARKTVQYNASEFSRYIDQIIATFTSELFEQHFGNGHPSQRPIFVCGMPRSGTTLAEQILSSHSRIFGAGELLLVPTIIRLMPKVLKTSTLYPQCMEQFTQRTADQAARYYLRNLAELDNEAPFAVDKLPHNFVNLGLIALMFPNAKIIHLRRDPRDVALSNYFQNFKAKHGGMGYSMDLRDIGHQINDHDRLMEHWHQVLPIPIFELDYEAMVEDQENTTQALLDFVGVNWDEKVKDFYQTERAVRTASVWQVRQPIYQSSKQKWRRYEQYLQPLLEVLSSANGSELLSG